MTHSLLPDFFHPHRHFVTHLLQHVVSLYLLVGLGWRRLLHRLHRNPLRTMRDLINQHALRRAALAAVTYLSGTGRMGPVQAFADMLRSCYHYRNAHPLACRGVDWIAFAASLHSGSLAS